MRKVLAVIVLWGCGASTPSRPPFDGRATNAWLAYDVAVPDRDPRDLVASFQASANALGCHTERLGEHVVAVAGGATALISYGVEASCDDGTLALISMTRDRVRIGCDQPTRARCDVLLRKISDAR